MTIRWLHLWIPLAGAIVSYTLATVTFWDSAKTSLLTALSVIAAGVLVRLARGLPFNSPHYFELDEIRQVTAAAKQSIRALRALITIVFIAMGAIVFARPLADRVTELSGKETVWLSYVEPSISACVGLLLTYVFVRIFSVISGDVGLLDLQSKFLVRAVQRKQTSCFNKARNDDESEPMKNPDGYGRTV